MDARVEGFYREIYADLRVDDNEAARLSAYFAELNPPPDKLLWLRSTAFRLGSEFLTGGDKDKNVSLLKCINYVVHAIESICMEPALPEGNSGYDGEVTEDYYREIFSDLAVNREESEELSAFFRNNIPPSDSLVAMRAAAFKAAIDFLSEDGDRESDVSLLRCINAVVHNFEFACYKPRQYTLKKKFDLTVGLSEAVQEMWNLDDNRLTPNRDYVIDVQEGKKPYRKEDAAEDPLFARVDRSALNRPTYRAFVALLDNYRRATGGRETISSREEREIDAFLEAILQTAPLQYCYAYLREQKGDDIPPSLSEFGELLRDIWFDLYRRQSANDSSGFEHVFVGEVKNGKVSGMHNWIQLYLLEKEGDLDYRGYIKPRSQSAAETNSDDHLLTLQFRWDGVEKSVGTCLIGTSPEFEVALYTTCFLLGDENNEVTLDTGTGDIFDLNVRCYKHDGDKIGTAFPEVNVHWEE